MSSFSRKALIFVVFVAVIAAGYAFAAFWQGQNKIPAPFVTARNQGAIIAEAIVATSNSSTAELAKIDQYDKEGNYSEALSLTKGLVAQAGDLRSQAVSLSSQIQTMTQSLSGVKDLAAQQDALEAISSELALINQLVNYSGDLGKLLETLQARFGGQAGTTAEVTSEVAQINTDINAINNYNHQATQALKAFDAAENAQ
jgi:hypothetical protein